ncbi:MAG: hypothetical protein HY075_13205 [Deltaproteobacteria bacterium]|nr:hypothetical protein [Deltaproteobacteria bacterium]
MELSRRHLLKASLGAIGTLAASSALAQTLAGACRVTPAQTEGPFYPVKDQDDTDNDLVQVKGRPGRAKGDVIIVGGIVTDGDCRPVERALVEIWQACASGRYNHPGDDNPAELDPDFQYWGRAVTNERGEYRFRTILPGAYPADATWTRPSHIHFKVHRKGYHELTTQMYFKGAPGNDEDKILQSLKPADRDAVIVEINGGVCRFDLALRKV